MTLSLQQTYFLRKKKLTAHWRNFIHPLMWRCKWTELRIKQLESQASKYARQDSGKHMAQDKTTVEQFGSNSLPISIQSHRNRLMKRRKRRRVENTSDIASYMSNHIIFSDRGSIFFLLLCYYNFSLQLNHSTVGLTAENKRHDLDGVPTW